MRTVRTASSFLARNAGVAVLYYLLGRVGFAVTTSDAVTPVWPAGGAALAILLLHGRSLWPGVLVGLVALWLFPELPALARPVVPLRTVPFLVAADVLEPVVGAALLARFLGDARSLQRVSDVVALLLHGCGVGALVSASVAAVGVAITGAPLQGSLLHYWWTWWVGSAIGVLVVTPAYLAWSAPEEGWPRCRAIEWVPVSLLGVGLTVASFFELLPAWTGSSHAPAVVFPFLTWCALRLGMRGAATGVLVTAAIAVAATELGRGPFAQDGVREGLVALQLFLGVVAVTYLVLAGLMLERDAARARDRQREDLLRRALDANVELNAQLEARVRERTGELEAVNRDLESFVGNVSHDLRAPLRAISAYGSILHERPGIVGDPEAAWLLGRVKDAAARMAALIDDLLAFARMGRLPLSVSQVDVAALAREAVAEVLSVHEAPAPEVLLGPLPPCKADPALLRQVLTNLIGNAVKYSGGRPNPRVEIGSVPSREGTTYFVRDNGVGFDMAYASQLFKVFSRLHGSEFEGTGVGLAIAARVIERHGGQIWAEAKVNEGATFWFRLPGG